MRRLGLLVVVLALAGAGLALASGPSGPDRGRPSKHALRAREAASRARAAAAKVVNLAPGSDPAVLPGPVLIADRDNNRLIEVSPTGHVLWQFPRPGELPPGQTFKIPDDVFFTPDGHHVIVTEEDDFVVRIIDIQTGQVTYQYGHPGVSGSSADYLFNPDDALLHHNGQIIMGDIKNCRVLTITPPSHQITRQFGQTGACIHQAGVTYGSPNGAFPMSNGDTVVTEINGSWVDVLTPSGNVVSSANIPNFTYPSDTNEVRPGVFLSADYTDPGAVETFTPQGKLLWSYAPTGAKALNQPSLALPLPNGDVITNDDYNDRVIVIDPHTNKIVWQYGHTGHPGTRPGYLHKPDGIDLAPPYNLMSRFR